MKRLEAYKNGSWSWRYVHGAVREEDCLFETQEATPKLARDIAFNTGVPVTDIRFVRVSESLPRNATPKIVDGAWVSPRESLEVPAVPANSAPRTNRPVPRVPYVDGAAEPVRVGRNLNPWPPPKRDDFIPSAAPPFHSYGALAVRRALEAALKATDFHDWLETLRCINEAQRLAIDALASERRGK